MSAAEMLPISAMAVETMRISSSSRCSRTRAASSSVRVSMMAAAFCTPFIWRTGAGFSSSSVATASVALMGVRPGTSRHRSRDHALQGFDPNRDAMVDAAKPPAREDDVLTSKVDKILGLGGEHQRVAHAQIHDLAERHLALEQDCREHRL